MKTFIREINSSTIAPIHGRFPAVVALVLGLITNDPAHAGPLTGSGLHLPGPLSPTSAVATVYPTIIPDGGGFTGTWSGTALPAWQGTFTATGPTPGSMQPTGLTSYDFSGLAAGALPAHSLFSFIDLDNALSNENFTLRAYGPGHTLIVTPWLESPAVTIFATAIGGVPPVATDTPGWNWDGSEYYFDGSTQTGPNPSITVILESNQDITGLDFSRHNTSNAFRIAAPVPEPSCTWAYAFAVVGGIGVLRRRSRIAAAASPL